MGVRTQTDILVGVGRALYATNDLLVRIQWFWGPVRYLKEILLASLTAIRKDPGSSAIELSDS